MWGQVQGKTTKNQKKKVQWSAAKKEMDYHEPHPAPNEKMQGIQWTERPTGALVAAGSLWPWFSTKFAAQLSFIPPWSPVYFFFPVFWNLIPYVTKQGGFRCHLFLTLQITLCLRLFSKRSQTISIVWIDQTFLTLWQIIFSLVPKARPCLTVGKDWAPHTKVQFPSNLATFSQWQRKEHYPLDLVTSHQWDHKEQYPLDLATCEEWQHIPEHFGNEHKLGFE